MNEFDKHLLIRQAKTYVTKVSEDIKQIGKYSGPLRFNVNGINTYKKDLNDVKEYRKRLMQFINSLQAKNKPPLTYEQGLHALSEITSTYRYGEVQKYIYSNTTSEEVLLI